MCQLVLSIVNWYSKPSVAVRWNAAISRYLTINSGVRQGSILSPSLFAVFINVLIVKLRESGDVCIVNNQYGCREDMPLTIKVQGQDVTVVEEFVYLGSLIHPEALVTSVAEVPSLVLPCRA